MSCTRFRVNPQTIVCLNINDILALSRRHMWNLSDTNEIRTHNQLVCERTLNRLYKLAKWLNCYEYVSVGCIWIYVVIMSRANLRVNPHSIVCLNVKKLVVRSRRRIWSLSDWNEIRTNKHLVRKRILNPLGKMAKLLSCARSIFLYEGLDCMLL